MTSWHTASSSRRPVSVNPTDSRILRLAMLSAWTVVVMLFSLRVSNA